MMTSVENPFTKWETESTLMFLKGTWDCYSPPINKMPHNPEWSMVPQSCSTLKRNEVQDEILLTQFMTSQSELLRTSKPYKERMMLPIFTQKDEIVQSIRKNQVIVIESKTGSGKTTQVPQLILDDMILRGEGSMARILITQPRRISAVSCAERVAEERGEKLRDRSQEHRSVGYQIRHEEFPPRTSGGSIFFCTTGIVLMMLRSNPNLAEYSHIIVDEVHERDMMTDFLLRVLKDLIQIRSDLKVILMSASMDVQHFKNYFGCPLLSLSDQLFKVTSFYLEDIRNEFQISYSQPIDPEEDITAGVAEMVLKLHNRMPIESGSILVFLTGMEEQEKVAEIMKSKAHEGKKFVIHIFHSLIDMTMQRQILAQPTLGVRKIILSTSIAETSVTIHDVVYVVDTGRHKMVHYDPATKMNSLKTEWISKSTMLQRCGRAGRVQDGIIFHLYSRALAEIFQKFDTPEITRCGLEEIILHLCALGLGNAERFLSGCLDSPRPLHIRSSVEMLKEIDAITANPGSAEQLTPLGLVLADLPLCPSLGKMILYGALFHCAKPLLTIACMLSEKDIFVMGQKKDVLNATKKKFAGESRSDHIMLLRIYNDWESTGMSQSFCDDHGLNHETLVSVQKLQTKISRILVDRKLTDGTNRNASNESLILSILAIGLYPNVGKLRIIAGRMSKYAQIETAKDFRIFLHFMSVNSHEIDFPSPWVVFLTKVRSGKKKLARLRDSSMIKNPLPFLLFCGKLSTKENSATGLVTMSVDPLITVQVDKILCDLIVSYRTSWQAYLAHKILNPLDRLCIDEARYVHTLIRLLS